MKLTSDYLTSLINQKEKELKQTQKDLKKLEQMRTIIIEREKDESSNRKVS
tara:strand:- start:116 stop:268 length:153 start_codon:yes stop_codon:yes gene_type:complete